MGVRVRKNPSGGWVARICIGGRRRSKFFRTKTGVIAFQEEMEKKLALGEDIVKVRRNGDTFAAYAEEWLKHHRAQIQPSTFHRYREIMDLYLLPEFGTRPMDRVTRSALIEFVQDLNGRTVHRRISNGLGKIVRVVDTGKPLSRSTIQNVIKPISAIFVDALDKEILPSNPASGLSKYMKAAVGDRRDKIRILSEEARQELERVAKKDFPAFYPILLLAERGGLRRGEILALQWQDVHFGTSGTDPQRHLLIRRSVRKGLVGVTKTHKSRRAELDAEVWMELYRWQEEWHKKKEILGWDPDVDWVFPSERGTVQDPDNVSHRCFKACLAKAGLENIRFHDLRHLFASRALQNSLPVTFVAKQMGHSSPRITLDTYAHLVPDQNECLLDRLLPSKAPTHTRPGGRS